MHMVANPTALMRLATIPAPAVWDSSCLVMTLHALVCSYGYHIPYQYTLIQPWLTFLLLLLLIL